MVSWAEWFSSSGAIITLANRFATPCSASLHETFLCRYLRILTTYQGSVMLFNTPRAIGQTMVVPNLLNNFAIHTTLQNGQDPEIFVNKICDH